MSTERLQRAFDDTAQLEKDWHVEWSGWSECRSWPLRQGGWWAFSKKLQRMLVAECFAPDGKEDPVFLQHLKDESRLRLRMYIYQYLRFHEAVDNDPSPSDPGS